MAIKLIALDMDGTTLNNNHITISPKNRRAILNAVSNGIIVVPATGRTLYELPEAIKKIAGIRFAITSNGSSVFDLETGKTIYSSYISAETGVKILKVVADCKVYAQVYYKGRAYTERGFTSKTLTRGLSLKFYSFFSNHIQVNSLANFVYDNGNAIEKINLLPDNLSIKQMLEEKLNKVSLTMTTSGKNSIEITNYETSKGEALAYLCRYLNIESDEVMAIGDNCNDLEMLKWAGLSVAVKNADPCIKNICNFITLKNSQSGVAYAIEHVIKKL